MWAQFFSCIAFLLFILYVPGYGMLYFSHMSDLGRILISPIISIAFLVAESILFAFLGFSHEALFISAIPICVSIGITLVFHIIEIHKTKMTIQDSVILFHKKLKSFVFMHRGLFFGLFVTAVLTMFFFVRNLDTANSIIQGYDCNVHLRLTESFLRTGIYFDMGAATYPQAFHILSALASGIVGASPAVGINALLFVTTAVLFPTSWYLFIDSFFPRNRELSLIVPIVSVSFVALPWGLMVFGPLFPNVFAMCLTPLAMVIFKWMIDGHISFPCRLEFAALFLIACLVLALSHPNAIFSAIVVLAPYCVFRIYQVLTKDFEKTKFVSILGCSLFCLFLVLLWNKLFSLPSIWGVTHFWWPTFLSKFEGVVSFLFVCLTEFAYPQYLLAIFVAAGFLYCVIKRENLWLVFSYLLVLFFYVVEVAGSGEFRHFLVGFWYTDSYRIAAMATFVLIPLASIGVYLALLTVRKMLKLIQVDPSSRAATEIVVTFACLLIAVNFIPNFKLGALGEIETPFGSLNNEFRLKSTFEEDVQSFDIQEYEFSKKVVELIGTDSIVLNNPFDGSLYANGYFGLNIYFQYKDCYDTGMSWDTSESQILRRNLSSIASSVDVQTAYEALDIDYVLLLDIDAGDTGAGMWKSQYNPEQWEGFANITDETPGFEVVLASGDMRLYRVVY